MKAPEWNTIEHFKPTENWGDPNKINYNLVRALDKFRAMVDTPIYISSGTGGKHKPNSAHYEGHAVDILFPKKTKADLLDLYIAASRFSEFTGIGVYPGWYFYNKNIGGLHLGNRHEPHRKLWMGVKVESTVDYIGLTAENLKEYGLV